MTLKQEKRSPAGERKMKLPRHSAACTQRVSAWASLSTPKISNHSAVYNHLIIETNHQLIYNSNLTPLNLQHYTNYHNIRHVKTNSNPIHNTKTPKIGGIIDTNFFLTLTIVKKTPN